MIRKTLTAIFLLCTVLCTDCLNAQTEKGDWLAGGTVGFRTNKNNSEFDLSPSAGYFFFNHFAAGVELQINSSKAGDIKDTDLGVGPFARYYFGNSNFRPFAITSTSYLVSYRKSNGNKSNTNGYGWLLGIGGAAFLNPSVALEGIAGYNYSKFASASSNTGFSLKFGFQVYINRNKMESLKKGQIGE